MSEALRLAHELILAMRDTDAEHWDTLEEAAAELRRLHAENEALLSETRTLVRQNGQWQALNAELVEALRCCRDMVAHPDNLAFIDAALARAEESK